MTEPREDERSLANAETGATEQHLQVASVTGVDWELSVAGLGGRSYAFVVDWHIRIVGAFAWWAFSSLLLYGDVLGVVTGEARGGDRRFIFVVLAPTLAIYLLYHLILEIAMQGRTPGKRLAGIRIVASDGQVPTVGALVVRNLLRIVDSAPGIYAVGLIATLSTRQSVRIGDLAAGTLLVYEEEDARLPTFREEAVAKHGVERTELAHELLARWESLRPEHRVQLAGALLQTDPSFTTEAALKTALESLRGGDGRT